MSHEIETINGKASFFAVREPAWHQLGEVVENAQRTSDALELAGLNYTVHKSVKPVTFTYPVALKYGAQTFDVPSVYATFREWPNGNIDGLGAVGENYQVVQTQEAAEFVEAITDQHSQAIWETGGSLRDGKQFFMTIKLGEEFELNKNDDKVDTWMVVASSHDGSMALTVYITRIRVVCANTLTWSLSEAANVYKVKHTAKAQARVADARKAIDLAWKGQGAFDHEMEKLMNRQITDQDFDRVISGLFTIEDDMSDSMTTARSNKRNEISDLYYASPTVGKWTGTAYGLWNAVSEYEQWLAPSRGKPGSIDRLDNVASRNIFEAPRNLSNRALVLL